MLPGFYAKKHGSDETLPGHLLPLTLFQRYQGCFLVYWSG